jgi:methionyl-tRNA synthetase
MTAPRDLAGVLAAIARPKRAVVTAGMPYANGPLHLGHLAGAHLPADIYARWLGMLIGRENVLFVCGTDDHGSTTEVTALQQGKTIDELVSSVHASQSASLDRYQIGLDVYSGTSRPECLPILDELVQHFIARLGANGMLQKRETLQWYDPKAARFLPDRFVRGRCPNPKCGNENAYSDECEDCGRQYAPSELGNPRSTVSDATPVLRNTAHLWLDMIAVSDQLQAWVESKRDTWRTLVTQQVLETVKATQQIAASDEQAYLAMKEKLPAHRRKYTAGRAIALQFESLQDRADAKAALDREGISSHALDAWGYRPITRDIAWGIPLRDVDPDIAGKTMYVWPESLIAPIAFSQVALAKRGVDPKTYRDFWCDPEARIYQFLGQDNVFFYTLMQGAMWLGTQADPNRLPIAGELQLTDIFAVFHLRVGGEKMSKSKGNFYSADQLLDEKGYSAEQLRYYLALLGLAEKPSDFDFVKLDERNKFLAVTLNSVFERPIAAAHSKFDAKVPAGTLLDGIEADTIKMLQRYVKAMEKANYPAIVFEIETYARTINSLFAKYKPHDDRQPAESRANALFSAFYVLKNLMIMLYPFVPATMERVRESLQLPASVFRIDEIGTGIPSGHAIGPKQTYFPAVAES